MLRNKELRWFAVLFLALSVAGVTIGFYINFAAGILAVTLSVTLGVLFYLFTRKRYKNIAKISKQIDLVLHDEARLEFDNFEEGELSILHSEIKKMTLRIREQNEALKRDRQYLADSLADIAHQLRTPLTSANLALSLLSKTTDENQQQEFIREATGLLLQTDWLVTSLLKLSRLDAGVVDFINKPINVNDLIKAALDPLYIPIELQDIKLLTDIPEDVFVNGDPNWLPEAFRNILKNCIDSVGEYGEITIICEDTALGTKITIRDNGPGFNNEDLPFLFDRFYRGENQKSSGFGIGLSLTKTIISHQNGRIFAENHPDSGAMFTISFAKVN